MDVEIGPISLTDRKQPRYRESYVSENIDIVSESRIGVVIFKVVLVLSEMLFATPHSKYRSSSYIETNPVQVSRSVVTWSAYLPNTLEGDLERWMSLNPSLSLPVG